MKYKYETEESDKDIENTIIKISIMCWSWGFLVGLLIGLYILR